MRAHMCMCGSATVEEGMVSLLHCGGAKFVITTLGSEGSMLMCRAGDLRLTEEEGGPLPVPITVSKYTHPKGQGGSRPQAGM